MSSTDSNDSTDTSKIEDITPDGDVILVLDNNYEERQRIRVSSTTLSAKSPVFKAMFGPHFREGQQTRSSLHPVEILLPEDSPQGVRFMCQLLHDLNPEFHEQNSFRIVAFRYAAVTAQKYQVITSLYWQMSGLLYDWLLKCESEDDCELVIEAIAVAYLLCCDEGFKRATALFINNCDEGILELVYDCTIDIIPARTLLILEKERIKHREKSFEGSKHQGFCLRCAKRGRKQWTICGGDHSD